MTDLSLHKIAAGSADYVEKYNGMIDDMQKEVNNAGSALADVNSAAAQVKQYRDEAQYFKEAALGDSVSNLVRFNELNNPLVHLFAPNDVTKTLAGTLVVTRATTATYFDRYGVMKTAAIDELRVNGKGALIEGGSTNNFSYSSVSNYANWLNVTENTLTVEAGTLRANGTSGAVLVTNTSTDVSRIHNSSASAIQYVANSKVTASCIVKSGNGGGLRARFYGNGGVFQGDKLYNIETRTASGGSGTVSLLEVESLNNGWDRVSFTFTKGVNVTDLIVEFYSGDVDNIPNQSMYIDFMMFEDLPFATSYIETAASPVTRSADIISVPFNYNFPTKTKGNFTIACDVALLHEPSESLGDSYLFSVVNSTTNRILNLFTSSNNIRAFSEFDGVQLYTNLATTNTRLGAMSIVSVYDGDVGKITVHLDGNSSQVDNTEAKWAELNGSEVITIGGYTGSSSLNLNGYIKNFRIFDIALTEDEVKLL